MTRIVSLRLAALLTLALSACIATPLPDPPSLDPPRLGGIVHVEEMVGTETRPGIEVPPGGLEPGTTLVVLNLETTEPPLELPIEADGSTTRTLLPLAIGDVLRVQARQGELRSAPVDAVVVALDAPLGPHTQTLGDCLVLTPALELDLGAPVGGGSADVQVRNDCAAAVRLTPRLRRGVAAYSVGAAPLDVAPGGSGTLTISFAGGDGTTLVEDVLLLDVEGPETGRRAISLVAR